MRLISRAAYTSVSTVRSLSCPFLLLWRGDGCRCARHGRYSELRERLIALREERGQLLGRERITRWHRAASRERVEKGAVFLEAVIEVRTSGQAARADAADQISLTDARAAANRDRGKMQVLGFEAVRVAQM